MNTRPTKRQKVIQDDLFRHNQLVFHERGMAIMGRRNAAMGGTVPERRFCSFFGCSSLVCSALWQKLHATRGWKMILDGLSMDHLLWGLMLLKLYNLETPNSSFAGVDEKTFRKWSHFAIECIADLHTEVVSKAFYIFLIQCLLICCFTFRFSLKTGLNRILVKIVCSALTV